jgi:hypothetical protein
LNGGGEPVAKRQRRLPAEALGEGCGGDMQRRCASGTITPVDDLGVTEAIDL